MVWDQITTTPDQPPEIDLRSPVIQTAFDKGLEYYQPVLAGVLLSAEAGLTDVSVANLSRIMEKGAKVVSVTVGPNSGVYVFFADRFGGYAYLATGFGLGYNGTGPNGFARFMVKATGGDHAGWLRIISTEKQDYEGPLFP